VVTNNTGLGPGIFSIDYLDDQRLGGGHYEVYFQVEEIGGAVPAWTHVGHANRVRSLAAYDSMLLAITDDATLWQRPLHPADVPWTRLGAAPLPAGLAVSPLIFCAGRDNGLYVKLEPFVTPWLRIGHANDVTGLAVADGHLFCATRDNSLWMRDLAMNDVEWLRIGHANQVVSMTANGAELVCATADRQLWKRPATAADLPWSAIGTAPGTVTGLAWADGLWVTTSDDRLWRFRV
jgi:hypothetical protein